MGAGGREGGRRKGRGDMEKYPQMYILSMLKTLASFVSFVLFVSLLRSLCCRKKKLRVAATAPDAAAVSK